MNEEEKEPDRDNYEELFTNIGYERSRKLVNYLMNKVVNFDIDYENPKRLHLVEQLRGMKIPYRNVFGKDMI